MYDLYNLSSRNRQSSLSGLKGRRRSPLHRVDFDRVPRFGAATKSWPYSFLSPVSCCSPTVCASPLLHYGITLQRDSVRQYLVRSIDALHSNNFPFYPCTISRSIRLRPRPRGPPGHGQIAASFPQAGSEPWEPKTSACRIPQQGSVVLGLGTCNLERFGPLPICTPVEKAAGL